MGHYYTKEQYDCAAVVTLRQKETDFPYTPHHPFVREDQRLIGCLNNGLRYIYPDLTSEAEFNLFYSNYARGHWLSFDVRVASKSSLERSTT